MDRLQIIVLIFVCGLAGAQDLQTPCPDIFQYRYDGGEWIGMVEIPSPPLGQTIKLNVMLSLRAQLPTVRLLMGGGFGHRQNLNFYNLIIFNVRHARI